MTQPELFDGPALLPLAPGACVLRGFAAADAPALWACLQAEVLPQAPWRHLVTPGGYTMSVAMTNCGRVGWVSDSSGYRYDPVDPLSGQSWPGMPPALLQLAAQAAAAAGFPGFVPDACLVNHYVAGSRLSLHQDRDERDHQAPIVSVSLGLPATFLFGGLRRTDRPQRLRLDHGDVVVWGGPSRLAYHGVAPLAAGEHALLGACRVNLTFRKAL
ncbi:DNA oxidative demethylase AlkB [Ideonella sp. BN130291]|uniref:DNA oxidative demethylase AlkB n=1 Tax=Ideonella sp. BN130291 TaxID=3112940 RepID=UPI002E260402|nr:DNA oxidative demethylase AlkB [Ideonella sp. BN130291]